MPHRAGSPSRRSPTPCLHDLASVLLNLLLAFSCRAMKRSCSDGARSRSLRDWCVGSMVIDMCCGSGNLAVGDRQR